MILLLLSVQGEDIIEHHADKCITLSNIAREMGGP
jgi:hypothetical protein